MPTSKLGLFGAMAIAACSADEKNGSTTASTSAVSTGDETAATGSETSGGAGIDEACATWCEHELACHPDDALPSDVCRDACLDTESTSAECTQAFAALYLCLANLACDAESGCENEDSAIDSACGSDS